MKIFKLFLLPKSFISLYQNGTLNAFFFKLENLGKFAYDNNKFWRIELYCEMKELEVLDELGIYSAKALLGYFFDTNGIFQLIKPKNYACYTYYQIAEFEHSDFKLLSSSSHIELFEASLNESILVSTISELDNNSISSILRIPKCNQNEFPIIKSINSIFLSNLPNELFFEALVKPIFRDNEVDYNKFKIKYKDFYTKFNWLDWSPKANPCPSHDIILYLNKYHNSNKADSYLLYWGKIMAFLNFGRYNKMLTQLNEGKKQINYIFQSGINKNHETVFFSVDTESGTLEIYDYQGHHTNFIYGIKFGIKKQKRPYKILAPKDKWLTYEL